MNLNNNKINRRTALKTIGLSSIAVGGIIMGTNCCSPKKEEAEQCCPNDNTITYNEKDIIPCNALDCPDTGCSSDSNNESACCPSNDNSTSDNDNKKARCSCKAEPYCPANIYISEYFILWNECVREGNLPDLSNQNAPNFKKQCRAFLSKMNKIPKDRRADRCTECGECNPYCEHVANIQEQIVYIADFIKKVEAIV